MTWLFLIIYITANLCSLLHYNWIPLVNKWSDHVQSCMFKLYIHKMFASFFWILFLYNAKRGQMHCFTKKAFFIKNIHSVLFHHLPLENYQTALFYNSPTIFFLQLSCNSFQGKKVKCESLVHTGSSGTRQVPSRRILQCVFPFSWGVNISRAPCIGLMKTSQKGSGWKTSPHQLLSVGLITGQIGWVSTLYEVMLRPCNIQQRPHCVSELVFFPLFLSHIKCQPGREGKHVVDLRKKGMG